MFEKNKFLSKKTIKNTSPLNRNRAKINNFIFERNKSHWRYYQKIIDNFSIITTDSFTGKIHLSGLLMFQLIGGLRA